jgi:cell division protease FtsH
VLPGAELENITRRMVFMMHFFRKHWWKLSVLYVLLLAGMTIWIRGSLRAGEPKQVYFSDFMSAIHKGELSEVRITETELVGALPAQPGNPETPRIRAPRLSGMDINSVIRELEAKHIRFTGHEDEEVSKSASWIIPVSVLSVFSLLLFWRFRQGASLPFGFSKNQAKVHDGETQNRTTFEDVAGIDESKAELVEIVDFLRRPDKYQRLGGRIPKGVLLVGPPGTGKTLLAKAVAGEAGVPFFSMSGSEFVEMFVGVGAARVRSLFKKARQKAPCIIFIDEIDAIGKSRTSERRPIAGNDERDQALNQLLVEMDGFDTSTSIIIMGATNTPEVLDPALVRPGRFDRQVLVDRADLAGREAILRIHARNVKLAAEVDLNTIAARTPGMVGADLANIMNEAAILGARRNAESITTADLEEAIDRVMLGLEKNRIMSPAIKERVAYHETGHAIVALTVENADPVHRVSIIPRTIGALGHVLQLPTEEKYLLTLPELEDQISVMLGGRVSEEIVYNGVVSTGASNDLERASALARQIVTRYGMSQQLGLMTYGHAQSSRHLQPAGLDSAERNYSEHTAELIDREARQIIDRIYGRVQTILNQRREELELVARELIQKETLTHEELGMLLENTREPRIAAASS